MIKKKNYIYKEDFIPENKTYANLGKEKYL